LGALVLIHGLWTKTNQTKNAAYFVFILSAMGAVIAYLTGEPAEEAVEKIQGVLENKIELHEDSALYALISLIALGGLSVFALVINRFKPSLVKSTAITIFIVSLISFALVARTGYLGGQIRHTEIANNTFQNNGFSQEGEKDDD